MLHIATLMDDKLLILLYIPIYSNYTTYSRKPSIFQTYSAHFASANVGSHNAIASAMPPECACCLLKLSFSLAQIVSSVGNLLGMQIKVVASLKCHDIALLDSNCFVTRGHGRKGALFLSINLSCMALTTVFGYRSAHGLVIDFHCDVNTAI